MSGSCNGVSITPEMADTFSQVTGGTLGAVSPGPLVVSAASTTAKLATTRLATKKVTEASGRLKADDFVGADAMSDKQFRKLVKSISQNGLKNKEIEFVVKDGIRHVTFGSNRLAAAKHLRITDQLKFVEKTVPTRGFQTLDDVTRVPPPRFRGPPVTMQSN